MDVEPKIGVVENPPKWMVKINGKPNPKEQMDDLGGKPPTLPETNIAPENKPPQKETSTPTIHFQGLC